MVTELEVRGLCSTCIHQSECFSLKRNMRGRTPVFHCEEFDACESVKEDSQRTVNDFALLPCLNIKNLIPWSL